MTTEACRPLWLSVPAASERPRFTVAQARWRLLSVRPGQGTVELSAENAAQRRSMGPSIAVFGGEAFSSVSMPRGEEGVAREADARGLGDSSVQRADSGFQHQGFGRLASTGPVGAGVDYGLSTHRLDLALSAGRHAVERAKLDGARLLLMHGCSGCVAGIDPVQQGCLCVRADRLGGGNQALTRRCVSPRLDMSHLGVGSDPKADHFAASARRPVSNAILPGDGTSLGDPYQALRRSRSPEHAVLVGAVLATGQLGLPGILIGPSARLAGKLAVCMNATLGRWLRLGAPRGAFSEVSSPGGLTAFGDGEKMMDIPSP